VPPKQRRRGRKDAEVQLQHQAIVGSRCFGHGVDPEPDEGFVDGLRSPSTTELTKAPAGALSPAGRTRNDLHPVCGTVCLCVPLQRKHASK
jgi:hypothetical protein